jgi:deazaflavin-dependent oxidoreductase (nitroreductase family)
MAVMLDRATALMTNRAARSRRAAAAFGWLHSQTLIRTRGRIGGGWFGAPVLVLVTVGRKSGKVRRTPLIYGRDGDAYILVAANAGNDRPPSWWLNLTAADTADVLVRGRRRTLRWREVPPGADYDRLFAMMLAVYPPAQHYQGFTDRRLPILALDAAR